MRTTSPILAAAPCLLCLLACAAARPPAAAGGLPPGARPGAQDPSRSPWPPAVVIDAEMAFGEFEHETDGSNLDGDDSAFVVRARVEGFSDAGWGGGVGIEFMGTGDGMFDDAGFGPTEAEVVDFFVHAGHRLAGERLAVPLRAGFVLRAYELSEEGTDDSVSYDTLGLRLEAEPEVALIRSESLVWSLRARAGYTFGWTEVSTDPGTFEADADSAHWAVALGTRFAFDRVRLGIGYLHSESSVDASDVVLGNQFFGIDTRFRGLLLDFALAF